MKKVFLRYRDITPRTLVWTSWIISKWWSAPWPCCPPGFWGWRPSWACLVEVTKSARIAASLEGVTERDFPPPPDLSLSKSVASFPASSSSIFSVTFSSFTSTSLTTSAPTFSLVLFSHFETLTDRHTLFPLFRLLVVPVYPMSSPVMLTTTVNKLPDNPRTRHLTAGRLVPWPPATC